MGLKRHRKSTAPAPRSTKKTRVTAEVVAKPTINTPEAIVEPAVIDYTPYRRATFYQDLTKILLLAAVIMGLLFFFQTYYNV